MSPIPPAPAEPEQPQGSKRQNPQKPPALGAGMRREEVPGI